MKERGEQQLVQQMLVFIALLKTIKDGSLIISKPSKAIKFKKGIAE